MTVHPPQPTAAHGLADTPDRAWAAWLVRMGMRPIAWTVCVVVAVAFGLAWIASVRLANGRLDAHVEEQRKLAQTNALLSAGNLNIRLGQARSVVQTLALDRAIMEALARFGPDVSPSGLPVEQRASHWNADPELRQISERLSRVVRQFGLNTLWLTHAAGDAIAEGHAEGLSPFFGRQLWRSRVLQSGSARGGRASICCWAGDKGL